MKKTTLYLLSFCLAALLPGCENGFDSLNTNQTAPVALNPVYLLNTAVINSSYIGNTLVYEMAIVQQMVSPNSGVLAGGNFNQDNRPVTQGNWQRYYRDVYKSLADVIAKTENDPGRANLYHMARIWRAYTTMVLTDTYGDVPFTEAGQGFLLGAATPRYEAQQQIYATLLTELEESSAALSAAGTVETAEVLYGGDVANWKRLGNSLLLRAAMRLTKVDPNLAQQYAAKAFAGGVMQSNADNAVVKHTSLYTNAVGNTLNSTEANNFYLAAPFVNYLKANRDPRLAAIAVRYVGAKSGSEQTPALAKADTALQVGMPLGYDNGTIAPVAAAAGLASFYDYSQLDRSRMGSQFAPAYLVTYAQTQLLLAEAAVRGWVTGTAATYYENGIRGHMQQLADYGATTAIPAAAIDAYIGSQPLQTGRELEQINTQYWVASFLNGPEAFANFRRSGYPALAPNPYPGKEISGQFIRRLTYPDSEKSVNSGNIQEAIGRQGADDLDTRVWWDRP